MQSAEVASLDVGVIVNTVNGAKGLQDSGKVAAKFIWQNPKPKTPLRLV
jgi:hypothetical protein